MDTSRTIDGKQYARMIQAGTRNLREHAKDINDLNVFPIPDGDTGDNMLLTIAGGATAATDSTESLSDTVRRVADGMLLSARGNSGVILSQFFEGIAKGFEGARIATAADIYRALQSGVQYAYDAVMVPTEGTMLTVMRNATEHLDGEKLDDPEALLIEFLLEAKRTLEKTPEMLPVLKKAGVVDSGGAGLICIIEGMLMGLRGESIGSDPIPEKTSEEIDISLFTEDSVLEFGYCTELLLRLQRAKTDLDTFNVSTITDYLQTVGDSVAAVKNGTVVKLHVHTATPHKVLEFCQQYGEFLKMKIENMSLQHNSTDLPAGTVGEDILEHKKTGIVAVCSGSGVCGLFESSGADVIVDGGQCMNPSTEDFLAAFRKVNADTVFVFPNNSNIILTARQAAAMFDGSDVRVIESRTIGEGYAALSMLDTDCGDADAVESALRCAMEGVVTAEISKSVRDTADTKCGEYIGFVGKDILAKSPDRYIAATATVDSLDFSDHEVCLIVAGKDTDISEAQRLCDYITSKHPRSEVYVIEGMQEIYDYILVLE